MKMRSLDDLPVNAMSLLGGLLLLGALYVGASALPELVRYMRIRRM